MKLKLLINTHMPTFTKSEHKVAEYVLNHTDEILHMTLGDLSNATGVGDATILRFCNKIGLDKFGSLKLNIAMDLSEQEKNDSHQNNTISFVKSNITSVVTDTCELLNLDHIFSTVDLIEQSKHLWFYGVGSSGITALEAEANFTRIGIFSSAIVDPHFQAMNASVLSEEDIIIAFTISGSTIDVYESLKLAKKNKAKIVVVTNYVESPIAKLADIVLLTAARENVLKGGTISGTVSQLCVIDALKTEYIKRHEKEIKQLKKRCADSIIPKQL